MDALDTFARMGMPGESEATGDSDDDAEQRELVRLARTDEAAMEKLLLLHHDRLARLIRRNLPLWLDSKADPDDVLQEVWARAFASISHLEYRGPGSVYAWLATIARHHILNLIEFYRSARRFAGTADVGLDGESGQLIALLYHLSHGERTPSQIASDQELIRVVRRAVGALHPAAYQAIQLRFIEGQTVQETARQMNRTPEAIQQLTYRALKSLREALRGSSFLRQAVT